MTELVANIDKPNLGLNPKVEPIGVTFLVSKLPHDFSAEYIVSKVEDKTTNMYEHKFTYNLSKNQTLYFKAFIRYKVIGKLNNLKVGDIINSGWSRVVPINIDQRLVKMSDNIIVTPTVEVQQTFKYGTEGHLEIKSSPMRMYNGIGGHKYSDYLIMTPEGETVYERNMVEDDLILLRVPLNILKNNNIYLVKVKHYNNVGSESNWGLSVLSTKVNSGKLFDLNTPYTIMNKRFNYFNLVLYTDKFVSLDMSIESFSGEKLVSANNQTSVTPRIFAKDLIPGSYYSLIARIKLLDGTYTPYRRIMSFKLDKNYLIKKNNDIGYLDKYSFRHNMLTSGLTVQSSKEIYSGTIFLTKHMDNKIYRYTLDKGKLVEKEVSLELNVPESVFGKPYLNVLQLHNGRVLLDYSGYEDNGIYKNPRFVVCEYNSITHKLTKLFEYRRDNEVHSTAESNSVVCMLNNDVYYIPSRMTDNSNLKLMKYDADENSISLVGNLPVNVTRYASLMKIDEDKILLIGGSDTKIVPRREDVYVRTNSKLWTYSISNKQWTEVGNIDNINTSYYNFKTYRRQDSKIVLFNAVQYGERKYDNKVWLIDNNYSCTEINLEISDKLSYPNYVQLINGEFLTFSSRVNDPQKVFSYKAKQVTGDKIVDNATLGVVKDLVVPVGKTITIESPYSYDSINIAGDSLTNTGKLIWVHDNVKREFLYYDRLITRPTEDLQDIYDKSNIRKWHSIHILEDARYSISNILIVPPNVNHERNAGFTVKYIKIGAGSKLKVTYTPTEDPNYMYKEGPRPVGHEYGNLQE